MGELNSSVNALSPFVTLAVTLLNNHLSATVIRISMSSLLHIDASVRAIKNDNSAHNSISKNIAAKLVNTWKSKCLQAKYVYRDVGVNPPAFITQDWIGAVFTAEDKQTAEQKQLLQLSDSLIAEVHAADIIVISTPMYNYGMPAQLKAWFDQFVRINKVFDFDLARGDQPLRPLMSGKTLVVITSSGEFGFERDQVNSSAGHLLPHLRTLSKYLGAETMHEIVSEYQEFADERHRNSLSNAYLRADLLGAELAKLSCC